jgi:DNA-binding transcriptional ArsR family regulator
MLICLEETMTRRVARSEAEVCAVELVDERRVRRVRDAMPTADAVSLLSETFKVLGDPTRVRVVFALSREELCVCDLANLLGASQSAVSHSLRALRQLRLVRFRREGKISYYSLDDHHIKRLLDLGLEHVGELV